MLRVGSAVVLDARARRNFVSFSYVTVYVYVYFAAVTFGAVFN